MQDKIVPAHVGNLLSRSDDFPHHALEYPQPGNTGVFLAALKQHLQSDTDPQKRFPGGNHLVNDRFQVPLPQIIHAVAKSADSRQDDLIGPPDLFRITRHRHAGPDFLQGFSGAMQIAHAIINDRYFSHRAHPS